MANFLTVMIPVGKTTRTIVSILLCFLTLLWVNTAAASKRVALVIGNSAYVNTTELKNPRNDAEDLAIKLEELGFEVVSGYDLDSRGMRDKVREFGQRLSDADVAMFFYAGHALQVNGRNYLAPITTNLRHEADLDFETIPMDFVQRQMERHSKTILLFLDACRDNPLARNLRIASRSSGAVRGLAREQNSAEGTFIAFATQPDNVALDGKGRNSPFTRALLDNIDRPGVEISTLMTDVRQQVFEATKERQIPWINSSLLGRFYFKQEEEEQVVIEKQIIQPSQSVESNQRQQEQQVARVQSSSEKLTNMRVEQLAWDAVKDSKDTLELQTFIDAYGEGFFGNLARLRLAKLKSQQTANLATDEGKRKILIEQSVKAAEEEVAPKKELPTNIVPENKIVEKTPDIVQKEKIVEKTPDVVPDNKVPEVKAVDNKVPEGNIQENQVPEKKVPENKVVLGSGKVITQPPKAEGETKLALAKNPEVKDEALKAPVSIAPPAPFERADIRQLQAELNRVGCDAGTADGLWGRNSRNALEQFVTHSGAKFASLDPSHEILAHVQGITIIICPAKPVVRQEPRKITCRSGQRLSSKGKCYWPRKARTKQRTRREPTVIVPRNRKSGLLGGAVH